MIQILKDKQSMYTINTSLHELPVVISLPHSGTYITSEMAENLMDDVIFLILIGIYQNCMAFKRIRVHNYY